MIIYKFSSFSFFHFNIVRKSVTYNRT